MPLLTWGDLLKAQDDNETIEEAIARIVQEHDDDASAHLDTGQSLQSHKASEIIDHLARSVYRDKLIFNRFQFDEFFNTLDSWQKSSGVTLIGIGEVEFVTAATTSNRRNLYTNPGDSNQEGGANVNDPIFETRVKIAQTTNQEIYILHGDPDVPKGWGFKIANGTLSSCYYDDTSTEQLTTISGITLTDWNIYRVEFVDGVSVKFYVNGVLKVTVTDDIDNASGTYMWYSIKTTANAAKTMYVQSLHYDEEYSQ